MIKDYKVYDFSVKEKIFGILEGMLLNGLTAFLFYNSWIAMFPGMALVILYMKEKKRFLTIRRAERLRRELKEFFPLLIAALQTGKSIENAFSEAVRDLMRYCEEDSELAAELWKICASVSVGGSLEKLLAEFADRSHQEELEYFAEVFLIARRSGGNLVAVMRNTVRMLQERMDAEEEIRTVIAEAQMEFYMMCVIPLGIIFYLRMAATDLIGCLYGNIMGVFVMTLCLGIYGGCALYGKRLLEIENG